MTADGKPVVTRLGIAAYVLAAGVAVLDQLSKWWIIDGLHLDQKGQVPVLPFLNLTMVENRGVSYGLMRADTDIQRYLLVAAAFAVVVALIAWARRADRPVFAAALGLVIGGAVGNNLIDRVRLGHVIDFIDVSALHFPWVFNVADSAISVGVVLLLLDVFVFGKSSEDKAT